jgi:osmotically-inducible protein OsmY
MKATQLLAMFAAGSLLLWVNGTSLAAQERSSESDQTVGEQIDDATITTKAKATLLANRSTSAIRTSVTTKDGVVNITGAAKNQAEKDLVTKLLRDIKGVKNVDNDMTIGTAKEADQTVGEQIDDATITTKAKATLLANRTTSAIRTSVTTTDGSVTITGTAENQAEKDLVTKLVRDVKGVKDVKNDMTIGRAEEADQPVGEQVHDATITAKAKATLLANRSTSAIRTSVTTKDGIVTITGTAKNLAEKDLVTNLVRDIKGVKDVKNDMTIAE